jgi:hypothetical protein
MNRRGTLDVRLMAAQKVADDAAAADRATQNKVMSDKKAARAVKSGESTFAQKSQHYAAKLEAYDDKQTLKRRGGVDNSLTTAGGRAAQKHDEMLVNDLAKGLLYPSRKHDDGAEADAAGDADAAAESKDAGGAAEIVDSHKWRRGEKDGRIRRAAAVTTASDKPVLIAVPSVISSNSDSNPVGAALAAAALALPNFIS